MEIIRVVRGYLEQAGFQVLSARDATTALTIFRHDRPDLVVLDLNLPAAPGAEPLDGLPPEKMHCSLLAEEGIKSAIEDYQSKQK